MQDYENAVDSLEQMIAKITKKRENFNTLEEKVMSDKTRKELIEIRRRLLLIRFEIEDHFKN